MRSGIQNLENQVSQMATTNNRLKFHSFGKLPSQPETDLKNVSAIILRSGKEVEGPKSVPLKDKSEEHIKKELKEEESGTNTNPKKVNSDFIIKNRSNIPPFPNRLEKSNKSDKEKEILEIVRKVKINIPLLDIIKQMPRYASFLKDLCINKRKLKGDERVVVGENVSAVQEVFELNGRDELEVAPTKHLELENKL